MAKILVFHFSPEARIPRLIPEECAEIRKAYERVIAEYHSVKLLGIYAAEDGRGICEWEAPNAKVVEEIVTRVDGHPPRDGTVEVVQLL